MYVLKLLYKTKRQGHEIPAAYLVGIQMLVSAALVCVCVEA